MRALSLLTALTALVAHPFTAARAAEAEAFDAQEKQAIEAIVQDYLQENPERVVRILEKARDFYHARAGRAQLEAEGRASFLAGNPRGDLTVAVFFDYRCPYCREAYPDLMAATREDGALRLILKEFPVFGEVSELAARAAAAAARQGKYLQMHDAMMRAAPPLTKDKIFALAKKLALDMTRLRKDIASPDTSRAIEENLEIGRKWQVRGTPTIFIDGQRFQGVPKKDQLLALFRQARAERENRGKAETRQTPIRR